MTIDRRFFIEAGAAMTGLLASGIARAIDSTSIFPVVDTAQGKLRGQTAGGVHKFKGVRYGASTAGKNRFMPPAAPQRWTGIRDAFDYGQVAPQMPADKRGDYTALINFDVQPGGMGEDCLVANVWTPTLDRNAKLPVMLWLHGGGFYGGSGNSLGYDGDNVARLSKCVFVTINHRIGGLGFMDLSEAGERFASSGAVGMMDIVAALRWIRENIESFGGDPGRVLAFGQSGGGGQDIGVDVDALGEGAVPPCGGDERVADQALDP